ncbi:hypothetical protein RI367_007015 [Sorochytrium milnesiophthora]
MTINTTASLQEVSYNGRTFRVHTQLFINNEFVPAKSGKTFAAVNPSTGAEICQVAEAGKADIEAAVQAAENAYKTSWSTMKPADRGLLMYRLADAIEKNIEELAAIETLDNGKPLKEALGVDLGAVIAHFRYHAGWSDKIHGKVIDVDPTSMCYTRREPYGVVAGILPFNFPLLMLSWKLAPALATGNCIIIKTAEQTPLSALKIAELARQVGFPPGVINIVSGFGPDSAGEYLARHPRIRKVAFTGSTSVGRIIMGYASEGPLKKVSLELGGKSPSIVFDDADIDQAVQWAMMGVFLNGGQCCCASSRTFVQEGVYDQFIAKLKDLIAKRTCGDPFHDNTMQGPLIDATQHKTVLSYIQSGREEGAKIEVGGKAHGSEGYFVQPTLITNVNDNMKIAREEIFGPVCCVLKFKTEDEIIARANDTNYGLAASVFSRDINRVHRIVNQLHAGSCWVNCHNVFNPATPFGGVKDSGIGRECGKAGLEEYTTTKLVKIQMDSLML